MLKSFIRRKTAWIIEKILKKLFCSINNELLFVRNEVSEIRQTVRFLQTESPYWNNRIEQTMESFSSQWENIGHGKGLATDKEFLDNGTSLLEKYTCFPSSWFKGKKVLDAGCGNGRWSYIFLNNGAFVTAIDQSQYGVDAVKVLCGTGGGLKPAR